MNRKILVLLISSAILMSALCGCKIDVNELLNTDSLSSSHASSIKQNDSDKSEASSEKVDTDTHAESEITTDSGSSFDTSNYRTFYVTGASSVSLLDEGSSGGKVIAELSCGDSVILISDNGLGYAFVRYEPMGIFGYVDSLYLVADSSEVCSGETYYITGDKTPTYTDQYCSQERGTLDKNEEVTVTAKVTNGMWLIKTKESEFAYVSMYNLSEKKITDKPESSKNESKSEENTESTAPESKTNDGERLIGTGDRPTSGYTVYAASVSSGYLALRSEQSFSESNEIGQLYNGDKIYVIDSGSYYWYVYAPKLGMYGYVNSEFVVLSE